MLRSSLVWPAATVALVLATGAGEGVVVVKGAGDPSVQDGTTTGTAVDQVINNRLE